jgi:hypothetical protein
VARREEGRDDRRDGRWIEVRAGAWVVRYLFAWRQGRAVVAELCVTPSPRRRRARTWGDLVESLPKEGITTAVLRNVRLDEARRIFAAEARAMHTRSDDWLASEGRTLRREAARNPRRGGRSDEFYARIARLYVAEVEHGEPAPLTALGRRLGRSTTYVREALREARNRELLTPPPAGRRAGGTLTRKAETLLAQT